MTRVRVEQGILEGNVSETTTYSWTEFARTGVPSGTDGTPWPVATTAAPHLTVVDDKAQSCPRTVGPVTELLNSLRTDADHRWLPCWAGCRAGLIAPPG